MLGGITRMTYTMNSKVKQGDVWLADVVFKGARQSKQRPVIIVGNELALDVDVIIAPVTNKTRNVVRHIVTLKTYIFLMELGKLNEKEVIIWQKVRQRLKTKARKN